MWLWRESWLIDSYSTSVRTNSEKVSCLSVCPHEGHSTVTCGHFFFQTATPMPHASGRSLFGGDRYGPNHTSSGALGVGLSDLISCIPIGVTGRAAATARPRPAEKNVCRLYFQVE